MLEKIIKLLERFVVAHELIAANSAKTTLIEKVGEIVRAEEKTLTAEELDEAEYQARQAVAKKLKEDDQPEEKPKTRKPRQAKPKAEPEPDLDKLREEIGTMAEHIVIGDSDDCADEMDDLLDEYDARSVKKLKDLQVQEFHKELKAIVAKYYDIEE